MIGGCNAIFGVDDLEVGTVPPVAPASGGGGIAGEGGAAPTTTSVGGGGAGGSGGMMAAGGSGGAGGTLAPLEDRGLVVRYYLDEAASGQGPADVLDAAPNPLDLPITYVPGLEYVETSTGRGLHWTIQGLQAGAQIPVTGTKVQTEINGRTEATVEVVVDARTPMLPSGSIFRIGDQGTANSDLGLLVRNQTYPNLDLDDQNPGSDAQALWDFDMVAAGRLVMHVVIDTTQPALEDRMRLWIDGVQAVDLMNPPVTMEPPSQNDPIPIGDDRIFNLGNRGDLERPLTGVIYYLALYNVAMTDAERDNNLAVLTVSDDHPQ